MCKKFVAVLFVMGACLTGPAKAAFETFNLAPRPMGLVDTFATIGDEPVGMFYNPAQTAQMRYPMMTFAYSKPNIGWGQSDVNIYSAFYALPMGALTYGMAISYMSTNLNYSELIFANNLAMLYEKIYGGPVDVALGMNFKVLSMGRGDPAKSWDPALKPMTITKTTADAGMWAAWNKVRAGLSVANIIPADFGVVEKSEIPVETRYGVAYKDLPMWGVKITPALEMTTRGGFSTVSFGANAEMIPALDMQLGASSDNLGFGATVFMGRPEDNKEKYNKSTMRIDVSWLYPISGISSAGSPQLGLTFYF